MMIMMMMIMVVASVILASCVTNSVSAYGALELRSEILQQKFLSIHISEILNNYVEVSDLTIIYHHDQTLNFLTCFKLCHVLLKRIQDSVTTGTISSANIFVAGHSTSTLATRTGRACTATTRSRTRAVTSPGPGAAPTSSTAPSPPSRSTCTAASPWSRASSSRSSPSSSWCSLCCR